MLAKNTAKTQHFGKLTAFNRDFRDYLLSLLVINILMLSNAYLQRHITAVTGELTNDGK